MKVKIFGPNLRIQKLGSFHVHEASCQDCRNYGPRGKYGGEPEMPVEVDSIRDIVEFVYADMIAENECTWEDGGYIEDFHFAPCVRSLPHDITEEGAA